MKFDNVYFFNGTAYAGKSTMVKNPDAAITNFRACLEKVNSQENYDKFIHSGFQVLLKNERRSIEETMQMVESYLKL